MWRYFLALAMLPNVALAQTSSLSAGVATPADVAPKCSVGTTSGTCRDAALGIAAEQAAQNGVNAMAAKMPTYATAIPGTMYASTCNVTVTTATPTSTFCPVTTDSTSATKRTYPAGSLTVGKAFKLEGGGTYSVPFGNMNTADIIIKVGTAAVMTLTTPAAPVGTNQGVTFSAICSVRTSTTIACQGAFNFVLGGSIAPAPFSQTGTFNPAADNVIDVTGDWNTNAGAITTQSTTVTQAVLTALN